VTREFDPFRRFDLAEPPPALAAKLQTLGVRLDPGAWERLPLAARRRLADMPTEGRVAERTLAAWTDWLRATFGPAGDDAGDGRG